MTEEKSFYSTDHSETIRPENKASVSSYTPTAYEVEWPGIEYYNYEPKQAITHFYNVACIVERKEDWASKGHYSE